jgi:hypothetical protein
LTFSSERSGKMNVRRVNVQQTERSLAEGVEEKAG